MRAKQAAQVAFTYIGTVVGAGFATGQEILQFFTRYGRPALVTIAISVLLFGWLGVKMMLMAAEIGAKSYEDLNRKLFGETAGKWFSRFLLVVLFGTTTVMLAGAGSLFDEQFGLSYHTGLLVTLAGAYVVMARGMNAIVAVNSVVVPVMLLFTGAVVWTTFQVPGALRGLAVTSDFPLWRVWFSPLLYAAFNLALAQAVLVPLAAAVGDRGVLRWGGWLGSAGIGAMMFAAHFALSAHMPGIAQFEIPMGQLVRPLGTVVQLLYVIVIYGEIFTTYIADAFGASLQLQQRTNLPPKLILIALLAGSYAVAQIGFSALLSTLYPLFGAVSLGWFTMMLTAPRPGRLRPR